MSIDPQTGCIADEAGFEVHNLDDLRLALDLSPEDFNPKLIYDVASVQAAKIRAQFLVELQLGTGIVRLRPSSTLDDLPYKTHTQRELALMLEGKKPLAVFSDTHPGAPREEIVPEKSFQPYVDAGRILKCEHIFIPTERSPTIGGKKHGTRLVLYALPKEYWRVEAYLLLRKTAVLSGWSEGFERMEGSLLGYEDWQNDAHIELRRRMSRARGTTM